MRQVALILLLVTLVAGLPSGVRAQSPPDSALARRARAPKRKALLLTRD